MQFHAVRQDGLEYKPPLTTSDPPITVKSNRELYPVLRAGCIVSDPETAGATETPLRSAPTKCPMLNEDENKQPICVQQLYKTISNGVTERIPSQQISCTVHCCESDLCNGIDGFFSANAAGRFVVSSTTTKEKRFHQTIIILFLSMTFHF